MFVTSKFSHLYVKVKCTLVQALRFRTGCMTHRGSRGIALLFLEHITRRGWGVSVMPWPLFNPRKELVPTVQEARWAPGPVWTGAENFGPTGIWYPDRPACSQLLYQLQYLAHMSVWRPLLLPSMAVCKKVLTLHSQNSIDSVSRMISCH